MRRSSCLFWGTLGVGIALGVACSSEDEFSSAPVEDGGSDSGQGGSAGSAGTSGAAGADAATDSAAGAAGMDAAVEVCSDGDSDGVTDCDGDCDDADPLNFPGNPEICGDAADNDCDGSPDQSCGGLGTYVSEKTGSDSNPGTKASPLQTIGKGIANATTILGASGGSIEVYVAEGHYSEKVTLVENVNLLGGFSCTAQPCAWTRDPKLYDSAILNTDFDGVVADSTITKNTRIDGFRIAGKSGDPAGHIPGTVALRLQGGTPTVVNNTIVAGDATGGIFKDGNSYGIALIAPSNDLQGAIIDNNDVAGGASLESSAAIAMVDIGIPAKVYAVITRNQLAGGKAKHSRGLVAWASGTGTIIRDNDIRGGEGSEASWGIEIGSIASIDANRINTDANAAAKGINTFNWSGGIQSTSSTTVITNNVIFGAEAAQSAGVRLGEFETPAGAVVLNSNYIDGGGSSSGGSSKSAAVTLTIGGCCGSYTVFGRIANNVLVGGKATARFGVFEQQTGGKTAHPEALLNNDFFIPNPTAQDALYSFWNGSVTNPKTLIADVNALAAQLGVVSGNISADPLADATWHLSTGSPCIDAATLIDAPSADFEGEARPKGAGYDIGPDEAQ